MIKKEMSHILGRDLAHEALSSAKTINMGVGRIEEKLDVILGAINDDRKDKEVEEKLHYITKNTEVSQEFLSNEYVALYCREKNNKPRVLVCGFYGAKNVGDELMLKSVLELINSDYLDITILLSNNYDLDASEYAPYRVLHYPKRSSDILAIAENFDVVIWGGGAMLDDIEYIYRGQYSTMAYYLMSITKAVLKSGGRAFVYGVSTNDTISNKAFLDDLNYIIEHSDYFSLRDTNSLESLRKAGVKTDKIEIIDDLSIFGLRDKKLESKNKKKDRLCIGLNFVLNEDKLSEYKRIIKNIVDYFEKPIDIVLIPFYDYNNHDCALLEKIIDESGDKTVKYKMVNQPNNIDELLEIYGECDYIFSMRYHATLIAALVHKHAVMIDNQKNHRHYPNKNEYIKSNYIHSLPVLEYDSLLKKGIPKDMKMSETSLSEKQRGQIAENIKKSVQNSLKKLGEKK